MKNYFDTNNLSKLNVFMQQNQSLKDSQKMSQYSRSNSESSYLSSEIQSIGSERNQIDNVENIVNDN